MSRAAFMLVWNKLHAGDEIFVYVVNKTKDNNHCWATAQLMPTIDETDQVVGFHSNRRSLRREALDAIS